MSEINSPTQENTLIQEQDDASLFILNEEDVLVPGVADKHPRDMPEMAFVIAFCIQYNEAVGNLNFLPEELEDAIVRRKPVDLVERVHRYFLRNALNISKIIDKRYWIKKLSQHLQERIEKKEFIFSYNPLDRINNVYHELSNYEKVMILKDLVMWQFKECEKIQSMWQVKQSEKTQALHDQDVRPVEVEVLGVDTKGSTYFYLGAGSRIYRETPSANESQQCIWEALTTTLQDIKDLVSERIEIDPDRSEKEQLLYKKISDDLIPEIESKIEEERMIEVARRGRKTSRSAIRYNKASRKVPFSTEETEYVQAGMEDAGIEDGTPDENIEPSLNADESGVEPILSVSMWSVTRPSTNLQPVQTVHDIKCSPVNQAASVVADLNTSTTTVNSASEDDVVTTTLSSNQSSFTERPIFETGTPSNVTGNKRRIEEDTSDDDYSSDSLESNKRVKFRSIPDDDYDDEEAYDDRDDRESCYDNEDDYDDDEYFEDEDFVDDDDEDDDYEDDYDADDYDVMIKSNKPNYETNGRSRREKKGKGVLRKELHELHDDDVSEPQSVRISNLIDKDSIIKPNVDKGKGVLRHEGQTRIDESSSLYHDYDTVESSSGVNHEIFRPGPEDLARLEWSLNHKFFEGLEIFGEDSDSDLSDCCDACILEVDHS